MPDPGLYPHPHGEQSSLDEHVEPLDVPQEFTPASSYQVRAELEDYVRRDLLGPWGDEDEEFPPRARGPRERYLVGMLGPKPSPTAAPEDSGEVVDTETGSDGDGSADLPETVPTQTLGRIWASSMGMTFTVGPDVDSVRVIARWGAYAKRQTTDESGKTRTVWFREQRNEAKDLPLTKDRIPLLDGGIKDAPGVHLDVDVWNRGGCSVVRIALLNTQEQPDRNKDTAWLFQTSLQVSAQDGAAAVFRPVDELEAGANEDAEEKHLQLLYRHHRRYANGHNVAVHVHLCDGERNAWKLETTWIPAHDVPATSAAGEQGELSMDELAGFTAEQMWSGLSPLVSGYQEWLGRRAAEIPSESVPPSLRPTAREAVAVAEHAEERIRAGIELLGNPNQPGHADALTAFRFANEVMAEQRRRTTLTRLRDEKGLTYPSALEQVQDRKHAMWRPFQLAFVLLNLPGLASPEHHDRVVGDQAVVDLLFFPTGGGKTEAYLGLTAFTFAIRRLQGIVGEGDDARNGGDGVAVLMRYTLRLLTAQQFQRAAALVCAAEVVRRRDERRWGTAPFRIGLWVGGGVSPNWYNEAETQVHDAREAGKGERVNVLQTLSCPWCGTTLAGHRNLEPDETPRRVFLFCDNAEGPNACPFAKTQSREGLPIVTVDEEIYRLAPSLVIATVDKLAQLPWRGFAGMLFGRVRKYCPRHGYRHPDLDGRVNCTDKHHAKGRWPAVTSQPVVRLRPPDLIIQDELHLISGALGTTVGLFESAVDQLCTWTVNGTETGPKIVASTATTKRAHEQVLGVFGRRLEIFPPQVLDVADTYFSSQMELTETTPGRRYLGICAHGMRLKAAEIRVAEILLLAAQTLFDSHGDAADPYMTLVDYFNATRELAGMRRTLDDQVATRARRHGRAKGLSDRIVTKTGMLEVAELTSRISSADISAALRQLEIGFDSETDTSERRRAIVQNYRASVEKKVQPHHLAKRSFGRGIDKPVDVVLATSMLQVGVDVSRFGLMVVTGQPKNTAEYIQASSRVGRSADKPGLVVTLYNWSRPRDLAHYEDFEYYHATFYRQVEALTVTPYTRRSLDRTTAGALVAAIRNADDAYSRNAAADDLPLDSAQVTTVIERMLARAMRIGRERAKDYLEQRIKRFLDVWDTYRKAEDQSLGYDRTKELRGLLVRAGDGKWNDRTAGMSMRETENEINLLVPGSLAEPTFGTPEWTFRPPSGDGGGDTSSSDEAGDEMGIGAVTGKAGKA